MLETKDLILRQGKKEDWQELYQNLWSREEVFHYLFSKASSNEEAARVKTAAYAEMHQSVPTEFFVYEKASGQAMGIAGTKELSAGKFTVTDIAIGPDFSGRGYGKQVLNALSQLAFEKYGAEVLQYSCFAENQRSRNLALSCGFLYSHSEKAELTKDGKAVVLDQFYKKKND